ncbi:MAG TPA: cation:proton antiporter [Thermoplasmata archaeon]|jgi:Kef-type K+ transport system membrane component KefB|nr:cation:proton antiporter [Thermoplasmata archaeon]
MIDATTEFIIGLFILVASAVLVGELFTHLGQAPLVGQLLVGVVLGPTLLGPALGITSPAVTTEFSGLETLATFFVLMMAGLSISPKELRQTGVPAALLGVGIFFVPFLLGAGLVHLLYPTFSATLDLFVGLTISITALPVLGIMLREMELLETPFGALLMNASVVNELCAVSVFAILLRVASGGGSTVLAASGLAIGAVLLFLGTMLAVYLLMRWIGRRPAWTRFVRRFRSTWNSREAGFALLMVAGLGAALYSQYLGLTFVVGAFYAGLIVTPEITGQKVHRSITTVFEAVSWGFFVPLFFVLVGYGTNFTSLATSYVAVSAFAALVVYAIGSKFLVGSAIGLSLRRSSEESFAIGFLVVSRGAVELAMAVTLLSDGIFSTTTFTIVAGVGLITTIIAPIGARPLVRAMQASVHRARRESPELSEWAGHLPLPPPADPGRPPLPKS